MPKILTTNAHISCPHGGKGTSIPIDPVPKWTINSGGVLLHGDSGVLLGCVQQVQCAGYQLRSLNLNASQVMGRQVMLVSDFIQSFTGYPLTITESHNVVDDSAPA